MLFEPLVDFCPILVGVLRWRLLKMRKKEIENFRSPGESLPEEFPEDAVQWRTLHLRHDDLAEAVDLSDTTVSAVSLTALEGGVGAEVADDRIIDGHVLSRTYGPTGIELSDVRSYLRLVLVFK